VTSLIRYADDFVMEFSCEEDARRVLAVLPKRSAKYGLTIHAEKSRLVPFVWPDRASKQPGTDEPHSSGTFDLLGFTHFWSHSHTRQLGGEVEDVAEPIQPGAAIDFGVMSNQ